MPFYRQVAENRYEATEFTRGPWDEAAQHAGPPAALLGRAVERRPNARDDMRIARLTYEIHRPVRLTTVTVSCQTVRAGRSVELVQAELSTDDATAAMRVTALLIRTAPGVAPTVASTSVPPGPQTGTVEPFFPTAYQTGYHTAMDFRFISGAFQAEGPASCWFRMRMPLVDDEDPSPLTRVLIAADSGNGISAELDVRRHVFINADLTVHLLRYPQGEWICLDARTYIHDAGIGLTDTALLDTKGVIGRAAQSLFIAPR